jgi:hypothetical protein
MTDTMATPAATQRELPAAGATEDASRLRATALAVSEARLSRLVAAGPAVFYACRPDGDFGATWISPNVTPLMGYTPEDFTTDSGFWAGHIHLPDK